MKVKIRYIEPKHKIEKINNGDWIDLRTSKQVTLKAHEFKLIKLGIAMQLPDGYEAWVIPRSSTFLNWGILQTNSIGIIDNSYSGNDDEWMFPAYPTRDVTIPKGTRICQFRIIKSIEIDNSFIQFI